ncbi:transient-receptor-potential-like protein [Diadema antillarum]|uniref:transient-receptor-potential-like protein n=1 Tax=Diadema antillarum TaxID=105358 RepID=UPI003A8A6F12
MEVVEEHVTDDKVTSVYDVGKKLFAALGAADMLRASELIGEIERKNLQGDYRDEIGRSVYEYAIEGGFTALFVSMLTAGIPLPDVALLRCVAASFDSGALAICEYARTLNSEKDREAILNSRSNMTGFHSGQSALLLAAMKNNFVMVENLLEAGAAPLCRPGRCEKSSNDLTDTVKLLEYYRAVSSQAYLAHAHVDPLGNAFRLTQELREVARDLEEFNAELFRMAENVEKFAASLLDQASSPTELHAIFKQNESLTSHPLPLIRSAIAYEQKQFVGHAYSQKMLSLTYFKSMSAGTSLVTFLVALTVVVLYPFICSAYVIYQASFLQKLLKTPYIKMLMAFGSHVMLLILVAMYPGVRMAWNHIRELYSSGCRLFSKQHTNVLEVVMIIVCYIVVACEWIGRVKLFANPSRTVFFYDIDSDNMVLTYTYVYSLFFGLFFVLGVIVLLNLFIALMSSQLTEVQKNSDTEWKFGRAQHWLHFMKPSGVALPPPFNLLPTSGWLLGSAKRCFKYRNATRRDEMEMTSTRHVTAAKTITLTLLDRFNEKRRHPLTEDFASLKQQFISLRRLTQQNVRCIEHMVAALQDTVDALASRVTKLDDIDSRLDNVDGARLRIQEDDMEVMTDDVEQLRKAASRAMAEAQKTDLVLLMASMYSEGRTVLDDEEVRSNLESYRQDFNSYAANLYA